MNDTVMQPTGTNGSKSKKLGTQVETVSQEVRELGRVAGEDARQKLDDAREQGEQLVTEARTRSREAIESRPFTAVAVAAGLGALVAGILLKLR